MKQKGDAHNGLTELAIEQHLALWQTTRSLMDIETRLNEARMNSTGFQPTTNRSVWRWIRNFFTIFDSL